jgi:hypothetical protein
MSHAFELWNSTDCAAFFRCSRKHFMESIRPLPTFPRARYLPTIHGTGRALWQADEVRAWAAANLREARQSGKPPAPAPAAA